MTAEIIEGDCLEALPTLADASVDAVICDPPYGLGFMGKKWDSPGSFVERLHELANRFDHVGGNHNPSNGHDQARTRRIEAQKYGAWCAKWLPPVLKVLRPSGYLLAFGGTRTHHRLACAIEDAGFEIRDCLMWLYGTGFPKGKGCLKPAHEPIILARRPGPKVLPLGIDACRVPAPGGLTTGGCCWKSRGPVYAQDAWTAENMLERSPEHPAGRWPPNLVLTHHPHCERIGVKRVNGTNPPSGISRKETSGYRGGWGDREAFDYNAPDGTEAVEAWRCVAGCPILEMDRQSGERVGTHGGGVNRKSRERQSQFGMTAGTCRKDGGSGASRFFPTFAFEAEDFAPFLYCAKASRSERNEGLDGMPERIAGAMRGNQTKKPSRTAGDGVTPIQQVRAANHHPTVKPLALMRWLCRLVTPPGGLVLDPFAGSGSTGVAALREGFRFIGIEQSPEYCDIARARLDKAAADRPLLTPA